MVVKKTVKYRDREFYVVVKYDDYWKMHVVKIYLPKKKFFERLFNRPIYTYITDYNSAKRLGDINLVDLVKKAMMALYFDINAIRILNDTRKANLEDFKNWDGVIDD